MELSIQIIWLFILALPISFVAWTVTHEEIFREPREFCQKRSVKSKTLLQRKFFYLFTCEYCFSFYVTAAFLIITNYTLLFPDRRGYLIAGCSLIRIANIYMSIFLKLRTSIKKEGLEAKIDDKKLNNK